MKVLSNEERKIKREQRLLLQKELKTSIPAIVNIPITISINPMDLVLIL